MKTKILSPLRRDGFKAGMTMIAVVALSTALTMLTACSSDDSPIDNVEQRVPVTLAYSTVDATETRAAQGVNGMTRAAQNLNEGTFASNESVKVRISNTGAGEWTDYTFTTGSAGTMTAPTPAPYYPAGSQNIDIVAYYPAGAGETFTVAADQTADASYKASDLMFASVTNQAKQAEAVNLAFSHKMAKLCVNITAGQGVGSITSVSILGVKPTVSFNQATGEVGEASGEATTIAMSNNGAALIPAQTIDGGLLSIVTDKGTATYSVASKAFAAGQLYTLNITVNLRAVGTTTAIIGWTDTEGATVQPTVERLWSGALSGKFTIDGAGHKVNFSKGNLQATYDGSSWTWAFAENQWDYIGDATKTSSGNGNINVTNTSPYVNMTDLTTATVDLFGWVGASSTWTDEARLYGITSSGVTNATNGYGNSTSDFLKSDWGNLPISNGGGIKGSGWRTLTSAEWKYVFYSRSASTVSSTSDARYAKAKVNGIYGVILFPDTYSHPAGVTAPTGINNVTDATGWNSNDYSSDNWTKMEALGAVFLPAAGSRDGSTVLSAGSSGRYWSSSPYTSNASYACYVYFSSGFLNPADNRSRNYGSSVRLVRLAE